MGTKKKIIIKILNTFEIGRDGARAPAEGAARATCVSASDSARRNCGTVLSTGRIGRAVAGAAVCPRARTQWCAVATGPDEVTVPSDRRRATALLLRRRRGRPVFLCVSLSHTHTHTDPPSCRTFALSKHVVICARSLRRLTRFRAFCFFFFFACY